MEFGWTQQQTELYDNVLVFAREALNDDVAGRDRDHRFPRAEWDKCGEMGLAGLSVAEEYGGMGLDAVTTSRVVEALGRGCEDAGLCFSLTAHLFACVMPIFEHGNEALKKRVVPDLCSGAKIGANAITEAEAGSDVFALRTTAKRDGDHYILDGAKSYVTNGPVADVFLVYATTNKAFGYMGITGFVVDRDTPGLVVGKGFEKMGLRSSPISQIYLEECRVPAENIVGREGQGGHIFESSMHWERACLFAAYLGGMERQLETVIEYAKERKQSGQAIGKYQAVSHRIVDMRMRLDAARLLLYRACWMRDRGEKATAEIAMAKIATSEAAIQSSLDAVLLHGGIGVIGEYNLERMLRDAVPSAIFSGTSEIQRNLIAAALGL